MQLILPWSDERRRCRTDQQAARRKRCAMDSTLPNGCLTNYIPMLHFIVSHIVIRVLRVRDRGVPRTLRTHWPRPRCWALRRRTP
jgi:hypothetical protein